MSKENNQLETYGQSKEPCMLENLTLVPSTIFGKCDEFADFSILIKNNRTNVLKFYQEYYSLQICKVITVIYNCKTSNLLS